MPMPSLPDPTGAKSWPLVALGCAMGIAAVVLLIDTTYMIFYPDARPATWTADTRAIDTTIGGHRLLVPANMIRLREQRRGGVQLRLDIVLSWPSLQGYAESRAEAFQAASGRIIRASLEATRDTELENPLLQDEPNTQLRLGERPGPAGLSARPYAADSPFAGQEIVFETGPHPSAASRGYLRGEWPRENNRPGRFVARCLIASETKPEVSCIRRVEIASGLTLTYRFDRTYLSDWTRLDKMLRARIAIFLTAG